MRLARAVSAFDCHDPRIDRLIETVDLDVLQLDYQWPTWAVADQRPWNRSASGFLDQLRSLHTSLYLDPQLHLITNAGGGNTIGCVEAVAEFLCGHDSADLLISAVRGDNVLASLEELMAEGLQLQDITTRTSVCELTQPLLAAQIEIGAGPLKTALDEGSRVLIAGCYDVSAPFIAAAISATPLSWTRTDRLAQLANVARWQNAVVEYDHDENLKMVKQPDLVSGNCEIPTPTQEPAASDNRIEHADVSYQTSSPDAVRYTEGAIHPPSIQGEAPSEYWKLKVTYLANYFAESIWEMDNNIERDTVRDLFHTVRSQLGYGHDDSSLEVQLLGPADATLQHDAHPTATPQMISLRYRHPDRMECEGFVRAVKNYIARYRMHCGTTHVSLSAVQWETAQLCCRVPREAVTVSVDTRPAQDWR